MWCKLLYVMCDVLMQLAEVFEAEIDPVMKMLGFCCGQKYVFVPQVLICYGKQLCTVPVNAVYYSYQNRCCLPAASSLAVVLSLGRYIHVKFAKMLVFYYICNRI